LPAAKRCKWQEICCRLPAVEDPAVDPAPGPKDAHRVADCAHSLQTPHITFAFPSTRQAKHLDPHAGRIGDPKFHLVGAACSTYSLHRRTMGCHKVLLATVRQRSSVGTSRSSPLCSSGGMRPATRGQRRKGNCDENFPSRK
jgi:hypothetical protein